MINKLLKNIVVFNSIPNNKILEWSKLKTLADNTINVTQTLKLDLRSIENIAKKKRENVDYQHLLLFPTMLPLGRKNQRLFDKRLSNGKRVVFSKERKFHLAASVILMKKFPFVRTVAIAC